MTDLENQFLENLITAAWPLSLQLAFSAGIIVGYYAWSVFYYRVLDAPVRAAIGRIVSENIIWVLRHSSSYQTSFELGIIPMRYFRWTWGIELEENRTFLRDGKVALLSIVIVNVLCGLWPIALFLFVFLELKTLSYVAFFPACLALIFLYSAFWSGRHEVTGMQQPTV